MADLDFKPQVVAETEETITFLDGNGAVLRRHTLHDSTPANVDFRVKDREGWAKRKTLLTPDPRRINSERLGTVKHAAATAERVFVWNGVTSCDCCTPTRGN